MGLATTDDVKNASERPVIIHYAGAKPWKEFTARWNDWVSQYKMSPFYDQKLIDGISSKILFPVFSLKKTVKCIIKKY